MLYLIDRLAVPMAVLAAGVAQVPTVADSPAGTVASAIGALAAGIIALTFTLDKMGKLPGGGSFNAIHAEQLKKIESLLAHRNPSTSRERFLELLDDQRNASAQLARIEAELVDIRRQLRLHKEES